MTSTDHASGRVIASSKNRLLVYLRSENFANVRGFLLSYREGRFWVILFRQKERDRERDKERVIERDRD